MNPNYYIVAIEALVEVEKTYLSQVVIPRASVAGTEAVTNVQTGQCRFLKSLTIGLCRSVSSCIH